MKLPEPRQLKSGNWFIQLRLGGVSVPVTAATKRDCTAQARALKADYKAGTWSPAPPVEEEKPTVPTLRQAIDNYIAAKSNSLSPATVRGYRIAQKNRFQAYMDTPLDQVTDWQAVYNSETGRLSGKTLKTTWGLIRSVYQFQMGSPLPAVYAVPVVKNERPFFDAVEINKFLAAVKGQPCEIGAMLALSSLRCSEILALTWEDVDLEHERLLVRGAAVPDEHNVLVYKQTNKTDDSRRYVPIFIPQLLDALSAVTDRTGYVVHYRSDNGLFKAINRVCAAAGLEKVGIHGLRHSFASLCVHLGIPEETAMQIGGWSDFTTMRKIYTHISQRDQKSHVDQLKGFYSPQNANKNANGLQTS